MAFAQALLECVVQFLTGQSAFTEFEKMIHHVFVDLDDLVDDALMRFGYAGKVGHTFRFEETVDDRLAILRRQVDRQAFRSEFLAQLFDQGAAVAAVDLVDDDDARQTACLGVMHHALGAVFDAVMRIDHDRTGFHRSERGQGRSAEIGCAGSVDQIDVAVALVDGRDRRVERLLALLLHRFVIGNRGAALDGAGSTDHAARMQQGLEQRGLARGRVADERDISDAFGGVGHDLLLWLYLFLRSSLIAKIKKRHPVCTFQSEPSLLLSRCLVKRRCGSALHCARCIAG